ncbi:hypothetical protein BG015_001444 [Linnemannia schmuckeri]|uniref:Uncharacterized protein n=1 Tax=Linnemannia schmuckeri TaxID=64567 RepID=A0A9P5S4C7_9FUNG|nr:hypothetical protein BG015_001444 [Linnemannia schmuckeri]
MEDTAINLAHRYVQAAEEHQDRQQWAEAVEMHFQAADQFLLATRDTQDQEVIKTLKFMNANHLRQGKDLQRKLAKAAAEAAAAAAAAAAAQQQPHHPGTRVKNERSNGTSLGTSESPSIGRQRSSSGQHQQGNSGGLGQRRHNVPSSHPSSTSHQHTLGDLSGETQSKGGDTGSGGSYLGTSSEASSNSSSAMIEESFTLIKSHGKDKSDPFNRFWEELENLVHKISNPVAFTSIPLDGDDPLQINTGSTVLHSPTSEDRPPLSPLDGPQSSQNDLSQADTTTKQGNKPTGGSISSRSQQPRIRIDPSSMQESFFIIDSPSQRNIAARTRSASTSETGLMSALPTGSQQSRPLLSNLRRAETSPRGSKTMEEYAIENQQLKMTLDKLSKRNLKLEKQLEGVMQMSVWTKDVQRSAMQLIKSQDILRPVKQSIQDLSAEKPGALTQRLQQSTAGPLPPSSASSSATTPTTSYDQMNPTTMQARLKELEEELQQLKLENAKQNHLMKKYKQRWEDLKESAKRRRNATPTPPEGGGDPNQGGGDSGSPVLNSESPGKSGGGGGGNGGSSPGSNPYSNAALAGSPSGLGQVARPPFSVLSRSSSASGPVVLPGGSYQRRIMMESKANGVLDHTPFNMHRQASAGMVSSTTPRVLDTSPRTNVGALPFVPEIPRQPMASGATAAVSVGSPALPSPQSPSTTTSDATTATGARPASNLSTPVSVPSPMPGSLPTNS